MAEAVGALRRFSLGDFARPSFSWVREIVLPLLVVVVFLFALTASLGRAGVLRSWSADYSGRGEFLVESCSESLRRGPDQWSCTGWFTAADESSAVRSQLTTSLGAYVSDRPYIGERFDVFHPVDEVAEVYPIEFQLNEVARLYMSLLPRLLLMIGALIWLAGWFTTRNLDSEDLVTGDSIRIPQRFGWRSRGVTWMAVALGTYGLYLLVSIRVIGSLNIL